MNSQCFKQVRWSNKQRCYVGSVPELSINGVRGKSRNEVYSKLCRLDQALSGQYDSLTHRTQA